MRNDDLEMTGQKDYWRTYRYTADPFARPATAEPFLSDSWYEYLDLLPQFLRYCNSLILITGVPGVGKTRLVEQFIKQNDGDSKIISITAAQCLGAEYLLQLLHEHFSAPYDPNNEASISDKIQEQIKFLKLNKLPRMLIIDDAEQLPLDVRQACLQIIQQQSPLETCLPILLVGNETLPTQYQALLTPKTAEQCLYSITLDPFDYDTTQQYLNWACAQVGEAEKSPFNQEDVDTLYQASEGIVARLNHSARNLLMVKLKQTSSTMPPIRKKIIWWAITLVVIIALLLVYRSLTRPSPLATTFTTPLTTRSTPVATPPQTTQQVANMIVQDKPPVATPTAAAPVTSAPMTPEPATPAQAPAPVTPVAPTPTAAPVTVAPTPAVTTTDNDQQPAVSKPVHTVTKKHLAVTHKPVIAHKQDLFTEVMQQKLALQKKRVLATNGKHYTMQLMASDNLHNIQAFIATHQMQATAMIVKTERQGKPWYTILYGVFTSKQQAHQALLQQSLQLQQLKPWIRTYASIQQTIRTSEPHAKLKK